MTPQYAAKADANQPELVDCIRSVGREVIHIHMVGGGAPDLIVGDGSGFMVVGPDASTILAFIMMSLNGLERVKIYEGANLLVEVKDGAKPPSKQKLTADEAELHASWPGQIAIWNSVDAVLEGLGIDNEIGIP